jgi:hypothetical protein
MITGYFGVTLLSYFKIGEEFGVTEYLVVSKGENLTLFIALCIAYMTKPIIQLVFVKRHL